MADSHTGNFDTFLAYLKRLLDPNHLPANLPRRDGPKSKYGVFLAFSIDRETFDKVGDKVGALNEQFKAVFGWKARTTGDGVIPIVERGTGLSAVVDVLSRFHRKYPGNAVVHKWGFDIGEGAKKIYQQYSVEPPTLEAGAQDTSSSPLVPGSTPSLKRRVSSPTFQLIPERSDSVKGNRPVLKRPRSSADLLGAKKGGRRPNELMGKLISRIESGEKKSWACISPNCSYRASGNPQTDRVFKHASSCAKLERTHHDIWQEVVDTLAHASLGAQLESSSAPTSSHQPQSTRSSQTPFLSAETASTRSTSIQSSQSASLSSMSAIPRISQDTKFDGNILNYAREGGKVKKAEEQAKMQKLADHQILKLICVRGLVPNIIDSPEWKELMKILNPSYSPTSASTFSTDYIPKEASYIRSKQLKELQEDANISITFDGNSTRRDSLYLVHATTSACKSYFLDGHLGSDEHHTTKWISSKVIKSIESIRIGRVAAICSDSTSVTLNTRRDIHNTIPTVINLNDVCHHLHNTIKDIAKLPDFAPHLKTLKTIIAYISRSILARALLRKGTGGDTNQRPPAVQKIGKTRFGTHYSAAKVILDCLPDIRQLVGKGDITFKNKSIQNLFASRFPLEYGKFELALLHYIRINDPLVRSLWSLEAQSANAADVFIFFTASAASLEELFSKNHLETGIKPTLASKIKNIFNDRYDALFANDIYFAAFTLDPRYPISDYLLIPLTANPSITIPRQGANLERHHPRAYDRTKEFLRQILTPMGMMMSEQPEEYLDPIFKDLGLVQAAAELRSQIDAYWNREYPFNTPIEGKSTLEWWTSLRDVPGARVLAMLCTKIFSILVNSMPDERTGSRFTWFNSPLRGNQHAQTLVDMIQIGQHYLQQEQKGKRPQTRPVVKFRDIDQDLLNLTRHGSKTFAGSSQDSEDEIEDLEDLEDLEDEDGSDLDLNAGTTSSGDSGGAGRHLIRDFEVNLQSVSLLDVLSDTPRVVRKPTVLANRIGEDVEVPDNDPERAFADWV